MWSSGVHRCSKADATSRHLLFLLRQLFGLADRRWDSRNLMHSGHGKDGRIHGKWNLEMGSWWKMFMMESIHGIWMGLYIYAILKEWNMPREEWLMQSVKKFGAHSGSWSVGELRNHHGNSQIKSSGMASITMLVYQSVKKPQVYDLHWWIQKVLKHGPYLPAISWCRWPTFIKKDGDIRHHTCWSVRVSHLSHRSGMVWNLKHIWNQWAKLALPTYGLSHT